MKSRCPWWVHIVVILAALLLGAGGLIALARPQMLVSPHDEINAAARVFAGYLVSRNVALAIALAVAWGFREWRVLGALMILAAIIQVFDAGLDAAEGRMMLVPGVTVLGALFSLAAARLLGRPFSKESLA